MENPNRLKVAWTLALVGAVALPVAPVHSREWPETAGWTIFEGKDYCGLSSEFEGKGETELSIGRYLDGSSIAVITNSGWSAKKDETYELEYHLDDAVYSGGVSVGTEPRGGRKGFVTKFASDFAASISRAPSIKIYLGDQLVDSLNLRGSAAAMVTVDRCLTAKRADAAAADRERRRFAHIADDPFANVPATPREPKPIGNPVQWITSDDYPSSALRRRAAGKVSVKLTIGADGRPSECAVEASSGDSELDQATCQLLTRRGRFQPATDATGKTIVGTTVMSRTWNVPGT